MSPGLNTTANLFPGAGRHLFRPAASSNDQWKKQYRSDDSPLWALVPTLQPIFSLFFMENLPTSNTDKLLGWLFKGSINNLFWRGWCLPSSLPSPPTPPARRPNQDPFWPWSAVSEECREVGGLDPNYRASPAPGWSSVCLGKVAPHRALCAGRLPTHKTGATNPGPFGAPGRLGSQST